MLLDHRMVDFIGTDAHRLSHRPPRLIQGIRTIYSRYEKDYADDVCFHNAIKYFNLDGIK